LATKACMATGAGLTTALIPKCGYGIMQTSAPEAMALVDEEETHLTTLPADIEKYAAVGIGPGMDTKPGTQNLLSFIIRRFHRPLVIDADGLNCLAVKSSLFGLIFSTSLSTAIEKLIKLSDNLFNWINWLVRSFFCLINAVKLSLENAFSFKFWLSMVSMIKENSLISCANCV
ncbi:MAG: hypothetical protein EOP55_13375, partial [Sphingobacteriales bacterium]